MPRIRALLAGIDVYPVDTVVHLASHVRDRHLLGQRALIYWEK